MASSGNATVAAEAAELVAALNLEVAANYCTIAAAVLVLHEHILTFPQEFRVMWTKQTSSPAVLFFINRYITLLLSISFIVLTTLPFNSVITCEGWTLVGEACSLFLYVAWAAFSALRVFALSSRDWRPASLTLVLGLVAVGVNIYYCIAQTYQLVPLPPFNTSCATGNTFSAVVGNRYELVIGVRSCLIASDFIVLLYTASWYWFYEVKATGQPFSPEGSLIGLMLKHGFIYFVVLAALNALHMGLWLTNVFLEGTIFIVPLSSVLISRFLLNLRESFYCVHPGLASTDLTHSTLKFAASFAAPLSHLPSSLDDMPTDSDSTLSVSAPLPPSPGSEDNLSEQSMQFQFASSDAARSASILEVRRSWEKRSLYAIPEDPTSAPLGASDETVCEPGKGEPDSPV